MSSFIDVHVHPPVAGLIEGPLAPFMDAMRHFTGRSLPVMSPEELADMYRSRGGRAVLLGWASSPTGTHPSFGNRHVAAAVAAAPDVFTGFGAVDLFGGSMAVAQVHEAARIGLRGLSIHPAAQTVEPSHRRAYPIWETAAEHDLVCLIHTGFTRLGAGLSGGGGVRLEPARPIHVDTVAAHFPSLRLVIAHTGGVWLDEALAITHHKPNVWFDLSGQPPKDWSSDVIAAVSGPLADRALFGSDYPFGQDPDEWIGQWEGLGLREELGRKLLHDNAAALLEWSSSS